MIKKIGIRDLHPGMYVHDLNCSWVTHPMFPTSFMVKDDDEVEHLFELGVSSLYIDTNIGGDAPDAIPASEVQESIETALHNLACTHGGAASSSAPSSREDLTSAIRIQHEAQDTIEALMADIRSGRHAELESIEPAVQGIVDSVFRNSDALIQLGGIRTRDQYTFAHSVSVSALLAAFARTLELGSDITRQLSIGGMLHDIGKTRVPDSILNKPGKLSDGEFEEMRHHAQYGVDILSEVPWISPIALQVTGLHHERYDGSGYPNRLKGSQISPYGQMASIVDVYDAITSVRVYHSAMSPAEAIRKLQEWAGQYFNAELVSHFIRSVGIYPLGTLARLESGRLAFVTGHSDTSLLRPQVRVVYDMRSHSKLEPCNLDLSGQTEDKIIGYEQPEQWELALADYLPAA